MEDMQLQLVNDQQAELSLQGSLLQPTLLASECRDECRSPAAQRIMAHDFVYWFAEPNSTGPSIETKYSIPIAGIASKVAGLETFGGCMGRPVLLLWEKHLSPLGSKGTMRFGSTAKVLLKCKLKYYRISECKGT